MSIATSRTGVAIAVLLGIALTAPAWGTTHLVDPGGMGTARTIGETVAVAFDGDTILIRSGTYYESVSTIKALHFRDYGDGTVTWNGGSVASCLTVVSTPQAASVEGIVFTNGGGARGGCIYLEEVTGGFTVRDCTFRNTTATEFGGGLTANSTQVLVVDCVFEELRAEGPEYGSGGAVYLGPGCEGSTFTDLSFQDCSCSQMGGAIFMTSGMIEFQRCTFSDCNAVQGGAFHAVCSGDFTIGNCRFESCEAAMSGGAGYLAGENVLLDACTFVSNRANESGGAIHGMQGSAAVQWSTFEGNSSSAGGAIFDGGFFQTLINNTFYDNRATASGAAVHATDGAPRIERCVFAHQASAPAVTCPYSTDFQCNDFWANSEGDVEGAAPPTAKNGNIYEDPLFCDAPGDDFTLAIDSPCAPEREGLCQGTPIGASDVGCGQTAIKNASWGQMKASFR